MKKIFSILSAGLVALAAISCVQEKMTVFDPAKATAPVLASYEVTDDGLSATYSPGSFGQSFNTNMPVNHSLVLVSVNGATANKVVSASFKDGTVTASAANISKALMALGCAEETYASFEMVIRASMQEVSKDNGRNGHVDSNGKISVSDFFVKIPEVKGNPWKDYTESSPWSLIGSIASTGNSWNKDEPGYMVVDGNKHVVMKMTLGPDDQFKFRKDGGWDTNFGAPGDTEPFVMTVGEAIEATPGGKNLAVPAQGQYDILLDEDAGTITIYEAFQTYPGFDEISNWTVIGAIASFDMSWNKDIQMTTDGEWHVAEGVVLTKDDQFKFRMDLAWDTNIGAAGDVEPFVVALDEEYSGAGGGKNLAVPADGTYDLLCNPSTNAFKIVESLGGKSPLVGDEPEPEPEPTYKGWGIIGDFNSWAADVPMTEKDGVWTGYFTNIAKEDGTLGGFKFRKDADWGENMGAAGDEDPHMVTLDEPIAAVANGKNLAVAAGFYKVVLDMSNPDAPTITLSNGEVWSLIGNFNEWGGDVDMVLTDGKWVAEDVNLTPGWKLRKNHDWAENRGGVFEEMGKPFAVSDGGDNIDCGTGKFTVVYDPEAETVTVTEGTVWSLIGNFNEWGGDVDMVEKDGLWVAEDVDLIPGWKIRKNHDWAENRGGTFAAFGEPFAVTNNGDNIDCGTGKFTVTYNPAEETITVSPATYGWSLIGVNGDWNTDIDMLEVAPGIWVSPEVDITSEGWKLRYDHGWDVNRGSKELTAEGQFVKGVQNGDNIALTGKFKVVYNANNGTVGTLVWGVVGSIAGIPGFSWNNDIPMNLASDGKWYSVPVTLAEGDQIKIRKYAGWDENFGGTFAEADTPFEAVAGGDNIKAEGTYQVIYDPEAGTITLSKLYWGIVGEFSGWGGQPDVFMLPLGDGKWAAYDQTITGPWKVRQGSGWDVNRGGTFVERGVAFEAVAGGDNITIADENAFDVIYDATAETITVL